MDNLAADFEINPNNPLNAEYELNEGTGFDCSFELFAAGTVWGSIDGNINNQTDLTNLLNAKVDLADFNELSTTVTNNYNELSGDISDLTTTVTNNYSTLSGQISDLTTTVSDNYILLDNRLTTTEGSILNLTDTVSNNYTELDNKISNNSLTITNINSTIDSFGDIVSYNAANFATSTQGALADSALQPNDNISELINDVGYITSSALPTVNNNTITIQKNNTTIKSFTLNQATDEIINISVPTKVSDLTNDSGYITSASLPTIEQNYNSTSVNAQSGVAVAQAVGAEATNRENADNNLQSQIDAITASSDVTDIVGTYAQLQAYDTTELAPNSIIKVLQDESQNDETTYYRWVITGGVGSWVLIGEEGPYYTKSEADGRFVPQTRTINGKALYSNITLDAIDVGALPSSTLIPTKTSDLTNDSNFIQNVANGTGSISVLGTGTNGNNAVNIGNASKTSGYSVAIGYNSNASTGYSICLGSGATSSSNSGIAIGRGTWVSTSVNGVAIGRDAKTTADYAIQLGKGTNATTSSLSIGFDNGGTNDNYQLLDGTTGLIPDARLSSNIARTSNIPTATSDLTNDSGYITGIDSSDVTTALGYTPYNDTNPDGFITSADLPTNHVTTDTDQNITGVKTFVGDKRLKFKATNSSSKMGFTAYDSSNREVGYLEAQGNGNASHKCRLGVYDTNTGLYDNVLGFEYYKAKGSDNTLHRYNLLCPPLFPSTTDQSFYIPMAITNGITSLNADNTGSVNISTLLPNVNDGILTITQNGSTLGTFTANQSGNTTIDIPTVDQTYSPSSTNAQSGVAINGAGFLQNTATGTDSLTILGTSAADASSLNIGFGSSTSYDGCIAIGCEDSEAGVNGAISSNMSVAIGSGYDAYNGAKADNASVAIGTGTIANDGCVALGHIANATNSNNIAIGGHSVASGNYGSTAIGDSAEATAINAIQLGSGTNNVANTFQIGNKPLLDITTGLIPDGRISSNIARTSDIPTATSDLTNDSGYITGIDSSDVTTALGYTPVNKAGDTMTGALSFDIDLAGVPDNNTITINRQNVDFDVVPSSTEYTGMIMLNDKNGNRMGKLEYSRASNGGHRISIVDKKNSSEADYSVLSIGWDSGGNKYCEFPNTTCVDGQWIPSAYTIASSVNINGSTELSYDISSFIPKDGFNYEILVMARCAGTTTNNQYLPLYVGTSLTADHYVLLTASRQTSTTGNTFGGCSVIPIGTNRMFYVVRNTSYHGTIEQIKIQAYRRIGTNS